MAKSGGSDMTVRLVSNEKIAETSSKGNQEKWLDNGKWYKLDQFGYEALAETLLFRRREEQQGKTPALIKSLSPRLGLRKWELQEINAKLN